MERCLLLAEGFTFICLTEISAFGTLNDKFREAGAKLFGASTENEFVHVAWRKSHKDLEKSPFVWLSDPRRGLSSTRGILDAKEGLARRATSINDLEGIIRFVSMTDMSAGRNPEEVLRVLQALQQGELCPAN